MGHRDALPAVLARRGNRLATQHILQRLDHICRRGGRLLALLQCTEHLAHFGGGRKDHVHQLGSQRQFAVAQFVEQVLGKVAQRHQFRRIEKTRPALDGVETAEYLIEQRSVARILFQLHQLAVHIGQHVPGFHQEVLQ